MKKLNLTDQELKLAMKLSSAFARKLPQGSILSADDLFAEAVIGIIDAKKKFNEKKGVKFSSYAYIRARGQIQDAMRKEDLLPKNVRYLVRHCNLSHDFFTDKEEYRDNVSCLESGLDSYIISKEESYLIKEEIEKLDSDFGLIVMLHFYDDLSLYDIGAIFNRCNALISIKLKMALTILRDQIKGIQEE